MSYVTILRAEVEETTRNDNVFRQSQKLERSAAVRGTGPTFLSLTVNRETYGAFQSYAELAFA